jgi:hypothetical protein
MSALALTHTPARGGTTVATGSISVADTISRTVLGAHGVNLEILNGSGGTITVTISDATTTRSGGAAAAISTTIANGAAKSFKILPQQADPTTKLVSITSTSGTTVTYRMTPLR